MDLSEEDIQKILKIIDELDYGEIHIEVGDLKIHLRKSSSSNDKMRETRSSMSRGTVGIDEGAPDQNEGVGAPAAPPRSEKGPLPGAPQLASNMNRHVLKAPISGVFYRAPAPGEEPFVQLGQTVQPGDTVCMVEIMKLFQSVVAGAAGRVTEIFVEDGEAIAEGQALLAIEGG
jgi:acetyl-CoA carboxylase biotin carboxyl carrier protein